MKIGIGREGMALCVLTVALCAVFALSVQMYDRLETETAEGALAVAAAAAERFLGENEAVAVFLGMREAEADEACADRVTDTALPEDARLRESANAYILRYNRIYAALR